MSLPDEIGRRIRAAREAKGLTQGQVAAHFGISRVSVTQWESGTTTPGSERFPELAKLLGGTAEYYLTGAGIAPSADDAVVEIKPSRPKSNASFPPVYQPATTGTVPLLGQGSAGPNGRFVLNGHKIQDLFCPPMLVGVEGAYAVQVYGTSMEPKFEAGETVWLHPRQPVRKGDYVVAQIVEDGDTDQPASYIKRFISLTSSLLKLEQLNPGEGEKEILEIPADHVFTIHKIVFHALV